MPTEISYINLQYKKTIGHVETVGRGFHSPVFVARGKDDLMYVLSRSSGYRPECIRVTVCTTEEEYITSFAQGALLERSNEHDFDDFAGSDFALAKRDVCQRVLEFTGSKWVKDMRNENKKRDQV